ncbi:SpoIIE family protein phosphatase [Streptomyces sp. NPDC004134]|uniref:PP2C family protein-serine/threonine phosphatase n=1 Tax=Streptomyces sp. NPDC004134 TaxID=3364691 RepID=UPI0036BA6BBF
MADDGDSAGAWSHTSAQLGALLDLVDEAVVTCDRADGTILGFNRAAARLFPRLRPGQPVSASAAPLARAAARGAKRFSAPFEGHRLRGHLCTADGLAVWLVSQVSSAQEAEAALADAHARSAFLEEATQRLGSSLHHGRTARTLAEIAIPKLADVSVVVLPASGRRTDWHRAGPGEDRSSGEVTVERLEEVPEVANALYGLQPRPTVVSPQKLDPLDSLVLPEFVQGTEPLVAQLAAGGVPAGALILLRGPERDRFDDADMELTHQFAERAGLALATAALYTQQAHTIAVLRASMAPEPLPSADGLRLGAAYRPAAEALHISGDFYHVAPSALGGVTFYFGDVSGKGAEAAVLAGHLRQSMRTLAMVAKESEPLRDLHLLNEIVLSEDTRFTTLVTGYARPCHDGSVKVEIAGGGHLSPLVLRLDGRVEEIACEGTLVGAVPDPGFSLAEFFLEPGELILFYSDGVTEAPGGASGREMYGEERLVGALASCTDMQAASVAERLELLTTEWLAGRPHDDISILTLQAPPRRGSSAAPSAREPHESAVAGRPGSHE